MAVGIVATLKIQADKIEAFETDFKALMAIVAEQEPGNNYYDLHRSREDAGSYVVMEQYVDQAALDLHGKSVEFKAKSARLGDYLAGAPTQLAAPHTKQDPESHTEFPHAHTRNRTERRTFRSLHHSTACTTSRSSATPTTLSAESLLQKPQDRGHEPSFRHPPQSRRPAHKHLRIDHHDLRGLVNRRYRPRRKFHVVRFLKVGEPIRVRPPFQPFTKPLHRPNLTRRSVSQPAIDVIKTGLHASHHRFAFFPRHVSELVSSRLMFRPFAERPSDLLQHRPIRTGFVSADLPPFADRGNIVIHRSRR